MRRVLPLLIVLGVLLVCLVPLPRTRKSQGDGEERFAPALEGKRWPEVLEWLSGVTGKPVIASSKPAGVCDVTTPVGSRYTTNEVIDLLNEDLLGQDRPERSYLFPRERSIMLVSCEGITNDQPLRMSFEELMRLPRTVPTFVSIVLPLERLDAKTLVPRIKRMMGPRGDLAAIAGGRRLLILDQASTLQLIVRFIRNLDGPK